MFLIGFKIGNKHCAYYWVKKEEMDRDERKSEIQMGNEMQTLHKSQ